MTTPNGAILFNNSTGSDTTASGLGGANVYGAGASTTGSSAVVTGIDTTGVSSGDLLWVQSSSGRQFSIIATVDSSTQVTCDDVFANTESGRSWAIGGKRATLDNADSRRLFGADGAAGFIIETETDQSLTSTISLTTVNSYDNYGVIRGSDSGSTKPVLSFSMNGIGIDIAYRKFYWKIKNLSLENTSSTKTSATGIRTNSYATIIEGVDINNSTNNWKHGIHIFNVEQGTAQIKFCKIAHTVSDGILQNTSGDMLHISNTVVGNCGGHGANLGNQYTKTFRIENCIFHDNGGDGLYTWSRDGNNYTYSVSNCIFYNNGGDGLSYRRHTFVYFQRNIFVNNGGYGIGNSYAYDSDSETSIVDRNAFYNNASGQAEDSPLMTNAITLTADPFVDSANGNFQIDSNSGGGATLRANNFALNTDTSVYPFRQYVSDDFDSGAGGGSTFHPLA